jgi:type VI secretion system protein
MAIKLRVISDHYRELGEQRSRVFGVNGGRIGRAPDNDWVLPDSGRVVSGHHCEIEYRSGAYWLRDTSTNGVFVNDAEDPVSATGPVALQDGDRLRIGDYELVVSIDNRIDFLPVSGDEHSAARHIGPDAGADLDVESLFQPRDPETSGSISVRNAFGLKLPNLLLETVSHEPPPPPATRPARPAMPAASAKPAVDPPPAAEMTPEWAMKTRAVTRQELAEAVARRQSRIDARQQTQPFHQQATAWNDLRSAVQAFCRGAGIEPSALTPEAQSMLPLVAGQLLREAVVGLNDLTQSRAKSTLASAHAAPGAPPAGSNPLRASASVEQALLRLFELHGRIVGGPVEALRDVLQEAKHHEIATQAALRAGVDAVLGQLAPANVADQFEHGRARALAAGQDPRPKYWEHYAELYRVITQKLTDAGLPHPFVEAYAGAYARAREELRSAG